MLPGVQTPKADAARFVDPELRRWVVTVGFSGTLFTIDTTTDSVYGPFLDGELGFEGSSVLDVAITPDGKTALVSNFDNSAVYFVDISNPLAPTMVMSVTTPMFAEDIAISPDGQYALVTDGAYNDKIAVIDMDPITLSYTVTLPYAYANAIDIARDGTVVTTDYYGGYIQSLYPDASGHLTVTGVYSYVLNDSGQVVFAGSMDLDRAVNSGGRAVRSDVEPGTAGVNRRELEDNYHYIWPVNVAIAPDGKTVLVSDYINYTQTVQTSGETIYEYAVGVYRISSPGELAFSGVVPGLQRSTQSFAFSFGGKKAYLSGNAADPYNELYPHYNTISVLNIDGPGEVSLDRIDAANLNRLTDGQYFGVDTIAVSGRKAYVGYPNSSDGGFDLRIVNLADYSVNSINLNQIPVGVAAIQVKLNVYLPLVLSNR
jgi:hypothetical protein